MKKLISVIGICMLLAGAILFAQSGQTAAKPAGKTAIPQAKPAAAPPAKPAATSAAKPAAAPPAKPAAGPTETVATLRTALGNIVIRFFPGKAPNHVKNFQNLCRSGFYNGTKFHRVIPGFMIQGGDPNTRAGNPETWGQGGRVDKTGKEINVKAEFNDVHHARGIVSMARAQSPDSASCQFFICVADAGFLDGKYSVFGKVIAGMDVVDKIVSASRDPANDRPYHPVAIDRAVLSERPIAPPAAKPKAVTH